ncbi:MAG: AAA family ATPase [Candidatus Methanoperedens sp.]
MTSVLAEIRQWATTLPYWEQAALDRIMAGAQFTDLEYNELLQYLLQENGLAESICQRPQLQFNNNETIAAPSSDEQLQLMKIFNMQNVNALVTGHSITFGPALTAIFGANGSGKSGYARVLGCAGFSRGDKEVLPDITQPLSTNTIISADFEISDGTSTRIIHYQIGNQCPELAKFYVFDSTSVKIHLTGSNTLSFSPTGLSYLTCLADVTDKVRERLEVRIEECTQPHDFGLMFQGESAVTGLIANLGPETNLKELYQMATLTPKETKRIEELDIEIATLKTQDIPLQVAKLTKTADDLINLTKRLSEVESKLSDDAISDIGKSVEIYLERVSVAQRVSVDQFKSEHFTQIGSDAWHSFIVAAKALAEGEQTPDKPYPQAENHCLLCQQPLTTEARDLLLRLWIFLEGEAQAKLVEAQTILEEKRGGLEAIDLNFFDDQSVSYRYLQENNMALMSQVTIFIQICRQRREAALGLIDAHEKSTMPQMPSSGLSNFEDLIQTLKKERDELKKRNPAQRIAELEQQLLSLRHRVLLGQHLSKIEYYIQKRTWAKKANKIGGNTRHITQKYKELFEQLVTDRYIELFEQTLKDLQRPLRVIINTTARKGETYKQIALKSDPTASVEKITPDKVLSEGEKRAVAIADFLTEVALDTTSSGIILDDPVTSLDLEWRETIASILVTEAKHRQVIVFTHDLPFLYHLKKYAERQTIDIVTHWIKRGDNDGKPGYVSLNNSPAMEREYRKTKKAREIYQQAKSAEAAEQENLLRQGFGALRTAYEAFIIFDLFNEVVMRFEERVSFGRLKDVVWDKSIVDEVVAKYELLSTYIEGHLHSDAFAATKPTCEMLLTEIEYFDTIKKKLKKLKED